MVKATDCGIVVSEFVLQSCYYVYFRANTLGQKYEPPYPPSYGLNSTTTVLLVDHNMGDVVTPVNVEDGAETALMEALKES